MAAFQDLKWKGETLPYLSVSQRSTLRQCPQKWWWAYVDGLRPERDANALWFGQLLHLSLADWYLLGLERGPHPAETFERLVADEERSIPAAYDDEQEYRLTTAKDLGIGMLEGYVKKYGEDDHQHWIATEQNFQVWIPPRGSNVLKRGMRPLTELRGGIDGVYRDLLTGEIWLIEHKGFKDSSTKHLPMDDQGTTYLLVATRELRKAGLIGPKEEIVGVMYNILRKALPPDPESTEYDAEGFKLNKPKKEDFYNALSLAGIVGLHDKLGVAALEAMATEKGVRVLGQRSKGQPAPLFVREPTYRTAEERINKLHQIQAEATFRDALVDGTMPVFKNQTKDCGWMCQFQRMCQLHEAGEDWEDYRDQMYITRAQADADRLAREERKSV